MSADTTVGTTHDSHDSKSTTTATKIAEIVSKIFNPLIISVPFFLVISLTNNRPFSGLLWWLLTTVGLSLAPIFYIARGVRKGRFSDHDVSRREQRLLPILFGLVCAILTFLTLFLLHASSIYIASIVSVIISGALALGITVGLKWKISLHLIGITGVVTVFSIIYGPLFLTLIPFIPLVAWARWQVRAHTVLQACAGTLLAAIVTLLVFSSFGLVHI